VKDVTAVTILGFAGRKKAVLLSFTALVLQFFFTVFEQMNK